MSAINTHIRRIGARSPITLGNLSAMLSIAALLLTPALALNTVGWAVEMQIIIPAALLGIVFGFALARSQFSELLALTVSALYGIGIIVGIAALSLPAPLLDGIIEVLNRTLAWTSDAFSAGINTDELVFTLLVALLFWFLAYNAAWHTFRLDRVWRVILPPALILLANMILYAGDAPLDGYLIAFLLVALLLLVRSNLDARQWNWYINGIRVPKVVWRQFAAIGILLSALALAIAWSIPSSNLQQQLDAFQSFLASDPIQQMSELWNRLFTPLEGEGPATTDYYGSDFLNLGGAVRLGDEVVMRVAAPPTDQRYYWRSRVFERYVDGQWSPSAELRITDPAAPLDLPMSAEVIGGRRAEIEQVFTIGDANSRIYYAAPQPKSIAASGRIDLIYTDKPANNSMNISVLRPLKVLKPGESYRASSLRSTASADDLRAAGTAYPEWVKSPNLYIGQHSSRIAALTEQIIRSAAASTPYDQAKAVERWLRANITYNESIPAPPPDVDHVEWVLFDLREGYCTYYATAMILMLRHLDIPARLAAGFSQGEYEDGQYIVRERDAHTWVEVYFPGYGWIEFEPTAAEEPYTRAGDALPSPPQPADPPPSPTPLSPTPRPSPTPLPSPTRQPTAEAQQQDLPQPTATLTPSPTPTATPLIAPPAVPPPAPEEPTPFALPHPLVAAAIVILLLLLLLALLLVLLFWWWEWRGMSGLSPISRAYARLERYIRLLGIDTRSSQTPLEKRRAIQNRIPAAQEPIRAISDLYIQERYGSADPSQQTRQNRRAERAWHRTRGSIIRRWLRRLLPFRQNPD